MGIFNFFKKVDQYKKNNYKGEYKDGMRHGQGTYNYPDESKYVGEWKDDMPNGKGTITYTEGTKYEGEWQDNKWHGQGIYSFPDGSKYEGEYKNNKQEGQGTATFEDGSKYEGKWKDNMQNGQGTYTFADGSKYVGERKDSKMHGQGTYTFADGIVKKGMWVNGTAEWEDDENLNKNEASNNDSQSVKILIENFQRDVQQYSEIFNLIIVASQKYIENDNREYPSIEDVKNFELKEEGMRNNFLKHFEEKEISLEEIYEIIDYSYNIMMLMEALHKKLFNLYDKGEIQGPMTPQLYYEYFSATCLRNSVFQTLIIINNDKKFKKILNELDESQSNNLINNIGKYMNKQPYIGYNYIQEQN